MKVILINGTSRAGKDTFVEIFSNYVTAMVSCESTIDPIKEIYRNLGWNGNKTDKDRENLNILKQIWKYTGDGPNVWAENTIKTHKKSGVDYLFIMVREYSEMMELNRIAMEQDCPVFTLLVDRPGVPIPPVEQLFISSYPANFVYDIIIENPTKHNRGDITDQLIKESHRAKEKMEKKSSLYEELCGRIDSYVANNVPGWRDNNLWETWIKELCKILDKRIQ